MTDNETVAGEVVERPDSEDVGQENAIENAGETVRESDTDRRPERPADPESEAEGFSFDG